MSKLENLKNEAAKKYILALGQRLEKHFNLYYEETREGEYFDLYAFHQQDFHKSFITRATVYEGFSVYEHMLVRVVPSCTEESVKIFQNMLVQKTAAFVNSNKQHKRSVITGILVSETPVAETLGIQASKLFHRQNYKFCFHGWSETQCVIISLADNSVYFPKKNKDLGKLVAF